MPFEAFLLPNQKHPHILAAIPKTLNAYGRLVTIPISSSVLNKSKLGPHFGVYFLSQDFTRKYYTNTALNKEGFLIQKRLLQLNTFFDSTVDTVSQLHLMVKSLKNYAFVMFSRVSNASKATSVCLVPEEL